MRPMRFSRHFDVPAATLADILGRVELHRRALPNCAGAELVAAVSGADGGARLRTRHRFAAPKFGIALDLPLELAISADGTVITASLQPGNGSGFEMDIGLAIAPAASGARLDAVITPRRVPLVYRLLMVEPVFGRLFTRFTDKLARFAATRVAAPPPPARAEVAPPVAPAPGAAPSPPTGNAAGRAAILAALPRHSIGAELGVLMGAFAADILAEVAPRRLHLIDPWIAAAGGDRAASWYASVDQPYMDALHVFVADRFAAPIATGQVVLHRALSWDVLETMPDASLDWVYVDADHAYESVLRDLAVSVAKVRPGGLIAGDDYRTDNWWGDGIVRAVAETCERLPVRIEAIHADQFLLRRH